MSEVKFVDGLFVNRKEQAPEFVISNLSFNEKFIDWLKDNLNAKGWCNVDIMKSKEGKLYAKHNDWKPDGETTSNPMSKPTSTLGVPLGPVEQEDDINVDEVPF